jgi:aminoglycoside phosphotransferase (APT) family kinase protein
MAARSSNDAELSARLAPWLARALGTDPDSLTIPVIDRSLTAGFSAETILFEAAWHERRPIQKPFVLRRQLAGQDLLPTPTLKHQWNAMAAMARFPHIPVPGLVGIDETGQVLGDPFLVMERLPGKVLPVKPNYNVSGWLHDLPESERKRVWLNAVRAIARVNRLDWRDGFQCLNPVPGREPGLDTYLEWLESWVRWAVGERQNPICDAALDYLKGNRPANQPVDVLWGDPNSSNMLFSDRGDVTGLLDWEFASLGPGEIDLAWWMMFDELLSAGNGLPRLAGLPEREEIIAVYSQALGRPVVAMEYYDILVWLRMAIANMRLVDRQVERGRFKADNDAWLYTPPAVTLARRLGMDDIEVSEDFMAFITLLTG